MKQHNFDKDERMFKIMYWIVIAVIVLGCVSALGTVAWVLWLITKAVTA